MTVPPFIVHSIIWLAVHTDNHSLNIQFHMHVSSLFEVFSCDSDVKIPLCCMNRIVATNDKPEWVKYTRHFSIALSYVNLVPNFSYILKECHLLLSSCVTFKIIFELFFLEWRWWDGGRIYLISARGNSGWNSARGWWCHPVGWWVLNLLHIYIVYWAWKLIWAFLIEMCLSLVKKKKKNCPFFASSH